MSDDSTSIFIQQASLKSSFILKVILKKIGDHKYINIRNIIRICFYKSCITQLNKINFNEPYFNNNRINLLYKSLCESLIPYIKKAVTEPTCPTIIADLAALLSILHSKFSFSLITSSDLCSFFINNDKMTVSILKRYLEGISEIVSVQNIVDSSHIDLLIKGWLRCLLLTENDVTNAKYEDITSYTKCIIKLPRVQDLFLKTSTKFSVKSNCFEAFLDALNKTYNSINDELSRCRFKDKVKTYFQHCDRFIKNSVTHNPQQLSTAYKNVSSMFEKIPQLIYTKGTPNTLLHPFVDIMLPTNAIDDNQLKLDCAKQEIIKNHIYSFVYGLFQLYSSRDEYIERRIQSIIAYYIPRLVSPVDQFGYKNCLKIPLIECFEPNDMFSLMSRKIFEILCVTYLNLKNTTKPPRFALETLIFFHVVIRARSEYVEVVQCFINYGLEKFCVIYMMSDTIQPCHKKAKDIVHYILKSDTFKCNEKLKKDVLNVFERICRQYLQFNNKYVFDFLEDIVQVASTLMLQFLMPLENEIIVDLEKKRWSGGKDAILRKGLERIRNSLNKRRPSS